jgi:hypothetical protein
MRELSLQGTLPTTFLWLHDAEFLCDVLSFPSLHCRYSGDMGGLHDGQRPLADPRHPDAAELLDLRLPHDQAQSDSRR